MTRTERLLRLARLRGDRAAELILACPACGKSRHTFNVSWHMLREHHVNLRTPPSGWTEAELRAAWGDR